MVEDQCSRIAASAVAATAYQPEEEPEGDIVPSKSKAAVVEYCCGPRSRIGHDYGRASRWDRIRLTIKNDLTTKRGFQIAESAMNEAIKKHGAKNILFWVSIPCTGGCPWHRINLLRSAGIRAKIEAEIQKMKILWSNMVK